MKIAVLFGGISTERNVSIAGGRAVINALKEKGYEVVAIDPAFGAEGAIKGEEIYNNESANDISHITTIDELNSFSPRSYLDCVSSPIFDDVDCAFLLLHGRYGEDGHIQALLEMRGVPYIGSGVTASALAMDKHLSKMLFLSSRIVTPAWEYISVADADDADMLREIRKSLGKNLVVKPANQGSTVGLTIIGNSDEDLADAIREAGKYTDDILVEQYIPGREITVAILDGEPLPIIEIVPQDGFYDYEHKYTKGRTEYCCPAEISEDVTQFTQNVAVTAYNALGCKGFARVDFILTDEGQPFCLEVNTLPGFTATSLVPKAAATIDIEYADLCETLINLAMGKQNDEFVG